MTSRITPALALASALALAACGPGEDAQYEQPDTPGEEPIDVRETPMPEYTETVQSDFTAVEGVEAEITGTLHLLEPTTVASPGAPMRVRVQVSGLPPGEHAWHIHAGACEADGEVVIPFTATADEEGIADPLTPDAQGIAMAEIEVPALADRWMGTGDHSIHVHEAAGTEPGPALACADL